MAFFHQLRLVANTSGAGQMEEDAADANFGSNRAASLCSNRLVVQNHLSSFQEGRRGMCIVIPDVQHP
jgi:hypothetical protein